MFIFSKRFAHGPESAVVGASFSRDAREFCLRSVETARQFLSSSYVFRSFFSPFLNSVLGRRERVRVFSLPASGVYKVNPL